MKTLNILIYSFHQLLNQVVDEHTSMRGIKNVGNEPLVTDKTRKKDFGSSEAGSQDRNTEFSHSSWDSPRQESFLYTGWFGADATVKQIRQAIFFFLGLLELMQVISPLSIFSTWLLKEAA